MKNRITLILLFLIFLFTNHLFCQDISLFTQHNGRYDFTFVGNTMNSFENNLSTSYVTATSSSVNLSLNPGDNLLKAYLYWAGSGDGDFEVNLNGDPITPDRTFSHNRIAGDPPELFTYFSAFKDITNIVNTNGFGIYTLSKLDISPFEEFHFNIKTNFAGWAILLVYENSSLPLNQINIYDGLQGVPDALEINLTNLFVLNDSGAKAGFIAWEGDVQLATETFTVNGAVLSNASNPINNVFNGTNSVTGASDLYNMDLDIYDIEDNIDIGDTSATITLTSWQDFIMINTVVTKLNSQLPDATIVVDNYLTECNTDLVEINYSVSNVNSTEILPANTTIGFYIGTELIVSTNTLNDIAIGGNETGTIIINLPSNTPETFTLTAFVDNNLEVMELLETNNTFNTIINLKVSPNFNSLENLVSCNLGFTRGVFDFSNYEELVKTNPNHTVTFYETETNAIANESVILNTTNYEALTTPKEIFIRIENDFCFAVTSFQLITNNCPPEVFNAVSANNDGLNDTFFIEGLRNIFTNFQLEIYNRWGRLIWTGNNSLPNWNGKIDKAIGNENAPEGTYYYILNLNDPNYSKPLTGYLYLTR
uniref:T9SS type B sorting domain-containing protein n=1 Tax=Flavobacterium sp. TaxID=239 RepID=UPI00404B753C